MPLDYPQISFPWEMFMAPTRRTDQNRRAMYQDQQQLGQDIAGIGQGLGQGLGAVGDAMKKKQFHDAITKLVKQSQQPQTPTTAGVGGAMAPSPQGQPNPMMAQVAPFMTPENVGQILPAALKAMQGKGGISPYQQMTNDRLNSQFDQKQKDFQQTMQFKQILADLSKAKSVKEIREKILAWQGSNAGKAFFGFGPTEENVGVAGEGDDSSDDGWSIAP